MSYFGSKDYYFEVARGNVPGVSMVNKFGSNPDIDSGQTEDIWNTGGTRSYLSAASTLIVVSSSTNDDGSPAGTGAQTLTLEGLNGSGVQISETVTMDGTTNVTTSSSFLRLYRAYVATAGSGGTNAGTITVTTTTGGLTLCTIAAGLGQSQIGHFTIPASKTGYITRYMASLGPGGGAAGARSGIFRLLARESGTGSWRLRTEIAVRSDGTPGEVNFDRPLILPALTDVRWTGTSLDNNTIFYIQYSIVLVDD